MSKKIKSLNIENENSILEKIWGTHDFENKKALVIDYIKHCVVSKKKSLFLRDVMNIQSCDRLDYFVTNISLSGRGLKVLS